LLKWTGVVRTKSRRFKRASGGCPVFKISLQIVVILLILQIAGVCYAAGNTTVAVTATVVSKSNCRFNSAAAALNFGSLDPANPVDRTVNTTIGFRCGGSAPNATFFISDDDGLNETVANANRMRHTTIATEYLPYSFTLNPTSGTVLGSNYQDAYVGGYSDTVILTIAP